MKKIFLSASLILLTLSLFSQTKLHQPPSKNQQLNEQYCNGLFKTEDGIYFDLLNDNSTLGAKSYLNILDWLNGRVAGLQVYPGRGNTRIPYIRNSRAGIYVDEVPVTPDFLNSLSANDIAMIKVIKGPFAGAINSSGGVIAIYTDRGDDDDDDD
jgi:TonB-dependent Receptor Plug Domain